MTAQGPLLAVDQRISNDDWEVFDLPKSKTIESEGWRLVAAGTVSLIQELRADLLEMRGDIHAILDSGFFPAWYREHYSGAEEIVTLDLAVLGITPDGERFRVGAGGDVYRMADGAAYAIGSGGQFLIGFFLARFCDATGHDADDVAEALADAYFAYPRHDVSAEFDVLFREDQA